MIDLSGCKTASEAAARWWTEKARNPGFWSNGDNSERGGMTSVMCTVIGNRMDRSENKIAKFEALLREKIDYILTAPDDARVFRDGALPAVVDHPPCPKDCTDEEYDAWEASFRPVAAAAYEAMRRRGVHYAVSLNVDYSPEWILREALREADLDALNKLGGMPAKTNMKVQFDSVRVAAGYGAGWKVVWGPTGYTYDSQGNVMAAI